VKGSLFEWLRMRLRMWLLRLRFRDHEERKNLNLVEFEGKSWTMNKRQQPEKNKEHSKYSSEQAGTAPPISGTKVEECFLDSSSLSYKAPLNLRSSHRIIRFFTHSNFQPHCPGTGLLSNFNHTN
jgi:hypothetical protein